MIIFLQILIFVGSLLALAKLAEVIIKSLKEIAQILNWSTFIVAFLVLGAATSTPELLVGVNASLDKTPLLSLGNLMGATIVLLTLITGLSATFSGRIAIDHLFAKEDLTITNIVLVAPILLLYDSVLSRFDSVIVIIIYGLYVYHVYSGRHKLGNPELNANVNANLSKSIFIFFTGLVGIALASKFAVDSAIIVGTYFSVPLLLLGVLVFSIGTNFPEIVVAFMAIRKRQKNIITGNVLGSAATNSLIIAIVSLISPIQIYDMKLFYLSAAFYMLAVFTFSYFVKSKDDITRREGFLLLSIYGFFVISEIINKLI